MALTVLSGIVIPAGQTVSSGVDCSLYNRVVRIIVPDEWTHAPLTFQMSPDGVEYHDVFHVSDNYDMFEVIVPHVVAGSTLVLPSTMGTDTPWVRIRSGSRANPIAQEADRSFSFIVEEDTGGGTGGTEGPPGPQGPVGATGATGPAGTDGAPGAPGSAGPAGDTGSAGDTGPAGADGAIGPTGPAGDVTGGETGPTGPQGDTGAAGADGAPGVPGMPGAPGAAGAQGDPGPAGAQGPAGVPGPDGPQGAAGPAGPQGAAGPAGQDGVTGPQGDPGVTGPQGDIGPPLSASPIETNLTFETPDASAQTVGMVGIDDADATYQTYVDVAGYQTQSYWKGMQYTIGLDYGAPQGRTPFFSVDGWHSAYAWQGLGVGQLEADAGNGGNYFNMQLTSAGNTAGDGNYINGEVGRHATNNYAISMWYLNLCDNTPQTGNNTGANFSIQNYDDTGTMLGTPFSINRATGVVNIPDLNTSAPVLAAAATKYAPEALTEIEQYEPQDFEWKDQRGGRHRRFLKKNAKPRKQTAVDLGVLCGTLLEQVYDLEKRLRKLELKKGK